MAGNLLVLPSQSDLTAQNVLVIPVQTGGVVIPAWDWPTPQPTDKPIYKGCGCNLALIELLPGSYGNILRYTIKYSGACSDLLPNGQSVIEFYRDVAAMPIAFPSLPYPSIPLAIEEVDPNFDVFTEAFCDFFDSVVGWAVTCTFLGSCAFQQIGWPGTPLPMSGKPPGIKPPDPPVPDLFVSDRSPFHFLDPTKAGVPSPITVGPGCGCGESPEEEISDVAKPLASASPNFEGAGPRDRNPLLRTLVRRPSGVSYLPRRTLGPQSLGRGSDFTYQIYNPAYKRR